MGTFTISGDIGSLADWAAVIVGMAAALVALAGAVAVAYLGRQANKQVSRTDAENSRIRQREADILTILFEGEVGMLAISLATFLKYVESDGQRYAHDSEVRVAVARRSETLAIPEVDAHFDRLHVLPDELCYSLSRLKGTLSLLRTTVNAGELASDEQAVGVLEALEKTARRMHSEAQLIHGVMKARRVFLVPAGR